jgi:hypothetical protein
MNVSIDFENAGLMAEQGASHVTEDNFQPKCFVLGSNFAKC